jgi:Cu2+-containing amine oxidase
MPSNKMKYGKYREYCILPSAGNLHLAVENSTNFTRAAYSTEDGAQVTQQHDTELLSAHPYTGRKQ